jgi:hypothetical protein
VHGMRLVHLPCLAEDARQWVHVGIVQRKFRLTAGAGEPIATADMP